MTTAPTVVSTAQRERELLGHTVVRIGGSAALAGATHDIDGGQRLV